MKTNSTFAVAVLLLLALSLPALSGCGGSGTFRDQDGYIQNPPVAPAPGG